MEGEVFFFFLGNGDFWERRQDPTPLRAREKLEWVKIG